MELYPTDAQNSVGRVKSNGAMQGNGRPHRPPQNATLSPYKKSCPDLQMVNGQKRKKDDALLISLVDGGKEWPVHQMATLQTEHDRNLCRTISSYNKKGSTSKWHS